jgi:hypothetical protein
MKPTEKHEPSICDRNSCQGGASSWIETQIALKRLQYTFGGYVY